MKRITESEIIEIAQEYINDMINEINNDQDFKKYNERSINCLEELQGYMSIYKYSSPEYKKCAYRWIKKAFDY